MPPDFLASLASGIETELGLPTGFLTALREDDDWSFVIKMHAFLDAALAHRLAMTLERPELEEVFARLSLSGGRTSKVAFARALGLLSERSHTGYLEGLAQLRNTAAHDVRQVNFTIPGFVSSLTPKKRGPFLRSITLIPQDVTEIEGVDLAEALAGAEQDPKDAIWSAGLFLAGQIYLQKAFFPMLIIWILFASLAGGKVEDPTT